MQIKENSKQQLQEGRVANEQQIQHQIVLSQCGGMSYIFSEEEKEALTTRQLPQFLFSMLDQTLWKRQLCNCYLWPSPQADKSPDLR